MEDQKLTFKYIEGFPEPKELEELTRLYCLLFEDAAVPFFKDRMATKENIVVVLAYDSQSLIAFKIGYRYNETTFYSWVGGVLPKYRRQGIAKLLAEKQEFLVKNMGYTILRTKSMNRFKPMIMLNIKNGFDITQVYINEKGQRKIVFEKEI